MKNTNAKRWTQEQYEVYASSFRDGDAILANGKWRKTREENDEIYAAGVFDKNIHELPFSIKDGNQQGQYYAFDSLYTNTPCEIATLDEYTPQDWDRVIWLGEHVLQFYTGEEDIVVDPEEVSMVKNGKVELWVVSSHKAEFIAIDVEKLPEKSKWGYIPRWENIKDFSNSLEAGDTNIEKNIEEISVVNKATEVLNDWYGKETTYQRLIEDLANMVSTVVLEGNYQLAQIGLNLIKQLEEEVK